MNIIKDLEYFVNDARNISGLVLSKADCTELLNLVKNGEMTKFDLEHEYEVLKEEYNANQKYIEDFDTTKDWYWKKISKLEKALDKAILQLQEAHFVSLVECVFPYKEEEKWKEWLMKDE